MLTEQQIQRYSRQLILKQIGGKGQQKLLESRVLIIGAGGLGSPAALYLAAAGVGCLGFVDFDIVDITNLQRQILHGTADIGRPKTTSAAKRIREINPDVEVVEHQLKLSAGNAMEIILPYDVIVDGSDNFPTRYLVNDACYFASKPCVHGSIFQFDGMATIFLPGRGCYRCLYPFPPPPGMVPTCQEAGVLGMLPGVIGLIQATETLKLLLGIGETLCGRLLFYDALAMTFYETRMQRNANCPLCGEVPTITQLAEEYEVPCQISQGEEGE
jgi:adenylyltransferase/sulfurtransferase